MHEVAKATYENRHNTKKETSSVASVSWDCPPVPAPFADLPTESRNLHSSRIGDFTPPSGPRVSAFTALGRSKRSGKRSSSLGGPAPRPRDCDSR